MKSARSSWRWTLIKRQLKCNNESQYYTHFDFYITHPEVNQKVNANDRGATFFMHIFFFLRQGSKKKKLKQNGTISGLFDRQTRSDGTTTVANDD